MHRCIKNFLEKLQLTALYGRVITRSLKTVKICYHLLILFYQQYPTVTMNLFVNHFLDDISNHRNIFAIIASSGRYLTQSHRSTRDPANLFGTFSKNMLKGIWHLQ